MGQTMVNDRRQILEKANGLPLTSRRSVMGHHVGKNKQQFLQTEIALLKGEIARLRSMLAPHPDSNTHIGLEVLRNKFNLPDECYVTFRETPRETPNTRRLIEAHMRRDDNHLYLLGSGPLVIVPLRADAVRIKLW